MLHSASELIETSDVFALSACVRQRATSTFQSQQVNLFHAYFGSLHAVRPCGVHKGFG